VFLIADLGMGTTHGVSMPQSRERYHSQVPETRRLSNFATKNRAVMLGLGLQSFWSRHIDHLQSGRRCYSWSLARFFRTCDFECPKLP
jgi:hypothetical protein